MATSGAPDAQDEPDLVSVPFWPPFSNRNRQVLARPPEIAGQRLLGLRGPLALVRQSRIPLLVFVADDRLPDAVRFREEPERLEPGTTVGEAFWPDGPPAWAEDLEAVDDPLPEEALERSSKAEALRKVAPDNPLHEDRRWEVEARLKERGHTPGDIRDAISKASKEALVVAPWQEELLEEDEERDGVWLRLDWLASYLNDAVTERLLDQKGRTVEGGRTEEGASRAVRLDEREAAAVLLQASRPGHADRVLVELWARLLEERAGLSPAQEEVWRLRLEGFSNQDIADQTGRAVGTVQSHLGRARDKLRKVLSRSM